MSTVILSATVAVLSGFKELRIGADTKSDIILCLSALSTVIAAWAAFYAPREIWHLYTETLGKLLGLKAKLSFQTCDIDENSSDDDSVKQCFEEFQQIMRDHNTSWQELRKK